MTAFILPNGKQNYETATGAPAVGWKLYTTDTGTNNPRTTWQDAGQVTPNANPIVLDARGEAVVFWSGAYRVRLEDNLGNTIWTVDGVSYVDSTATLIADLATFNNAAKGAGMVGFGPTVPYGANTVGGLLVQAFGPSPAEIARGVTPANYGYVWGDINRYGTNTTPGTTVMTTAIANMLLVSYAHRAVMRPETYLSGKQVFKSNYNLLMPPGCKVLDTGTLGAAERFFDISSETALGPVDNVHIEAWGATVQLIKANYGAGEQRHALNIAGDVSNIVIDGGDWIDSGGDGIYIGGLGGGIADTPERIRVTGARCNNNRRNAMSITAGKDVKVYGCELTNTIGTSPQFALDIEPDQSAGALVGVLEDIVVDSCNSAGNTGGGFSVNLGYYTAAGKKISISIINCVDDGSNFNFQMQSARPGITGLVSFINNKGYNALTNGFDCFRSAMNCLIDGMLIDSPNQSGQVNDRTGSAYSIYSVNQTDGSTYGNVTIRNSFSRGTTARKAITQAIVGEATSVITNVDAELNTDGVATKRISYGLSAGQITGNQRIVFTDRTEIASTVSLGASTMPAYLSDIVTNTGAGAQVVHNLSDPISRLPGVRATFRVKAAQNMVIGPGAGWTIGGGAAIWSNKIGSEVTLESDGVSDWRILYGGQEWGLEPFVLANSATPSVAGVWRCQSGGTTAITNLTGGCPWQEVEFLAEHAITITDGTNIFLSGSVNFAMNPSDTLTLLQKSDGKWYEVARSDNT